MRGQLQTIVVDKKKLKKWGTGEKQRVLQYLLMLFPGTLFLFVFNYLPLPGIILAFKKYRLSMPGADANFFTRNIFINSMLKSKWIGFDNFKFLFSSDNAIIATRNTVLYNLVFIILGLFLSVVLAIAITELRNRRMAKLYQTIFFLPFFLSWIAVSYLVYALLSTDLGVVNRAILAPMGIDAVRWYTKIDAWPFIIVLANAWKYTGNGSIIYIATITGFDPQLYEAAAIDGASKWQQIVRITIPQLTPIMVMLTILAVGRMFRADFALFFALPNNSGTLKDVTSVLDVYVYNMLQNGSTGLGRPAAAGLYQSFVGFILIFSANALVNKIDTNLALF